MTRFKNSGEREVHKGPANGAVLYLRVSTVRQLEGDVSIPSQRRAALKHCEQVGLPVVAEFVDGSTGTDAARPAFQCMLDQALAPDPAFDHIVVYSLSRFYRSGPESELLIRKLAKAGVRLVSVTQPIGDDPSQIMMRQLIGIFDEHTSRENGKNVRRAMRENAEQGFWNGTTPPLGYRTIEAARRGQKIKKRIEVDPVEAEVVKLIFDLYRNGEPGRETLGVKEVVKVLNRRGHRTRRGSLFGVGPTYNILTARYYATGRYPYGVIDTKTGKTNPPDSVAHIPIPTLISEDVFDAVQAKLRARNPRETPPRVVNGPCLLTGIVHCASCGAGMTRTGTVRGNRRYSYYTCRSNHQKGEMACKGRHVPMEKLDDIVLTALKERLLAPDRLRALLERLIDRRAKQTAEVSDRLECLRAEVADTTNRLRRLYALVEDGTAEVDDVLRHRIQVLRAEQARADAALGLASAQSNGGGKIDDGKIERFGQLMREKLDGGDVNARRAYIASVVSGIEVDDDIVRINGKRSLEPTLRSGAC